MGALQGPWRRHQQRIIARCHTGPAARGAFASALAALRETVPAAVACHGAVDPETWLPVTHADDRAARASCLGALWHNEYLTPGGSPSARCVAQKRDGSAMAV
jgi:hypothetical protein